MRVLLIDDDPLVRQMIADTLATESIEVGGLAEGALVLLGVRQVPDVLVADIDLGPGLPGRAYPRGQRTGAPPGGGGGADQRHRARPRGLLGCHDRFLRRPFALTKRFWLRVGGSVQPDTHGPARRPCP